MRKPCACGSFVTADPRDPTAGVAAHRQAEPHRSWSAREYGSPTARRVRDLSARLRVRPRDVLVGLGYEL